jgi:glutathione peroxidase
MNKFHWLLAVVPFMLFSAFLLPPKSIFDFSAKDIDEKEVSLAQYKGKVLLIVNTASECDLRPNTKICKNCTKLTNLKVWKF